MWLLVPVDAVCLENHFPPFHFGSNFVLATEMGLLKAAHGWGLFFDPVAFFLLNASDLHPPVQIQAFSPYPFGETPKILEFMYKKLCIYSYMLKLQSPSKYSPFDAMHLSRHFTAQF